MIQNAVKAFKEERKRNGEIAREALKEKGVYLKAIDNAEDLLLYGEMVCQLIREHGIYARDIDASNDASNVHPYRYWANGEIQEQRFS